jgi:hypothetical protein
MSDDGRKYLDFLQSVISRLAGNSFTLKGWSVGLASLIIGLTAKDAQPTLAWLALIPIGAFWILDGYYLALERKFRAKYKAAVAALRAAAKGADPPELYDMKVGQPTLQDFQESAGRPAVVMVHLPLALIAIAVVIWGAYFKITPPAAPH